MTTERESNYQPIDMVNIALHHKTYRVVYDPTGDFPPDAHIGGHELEFDLSAGNYAHGTILYNVKSKKTYRVENKKRGGTRKVVNSDKSSQAHCPVS